MLETRMIMKKNANYSTFLFCMLHGKGRLLPNHDLPYCQIRDNFAEKESRNPKDDTESKPSGFSKKKKYNRE